MGFPDTATFLQLCEQVFHGHIRGDQVEQAIIALPAVDLQLLDTLFSEVQKISLTSPRKAWILANIANQASNLGLADVAIMGRASWNMAWAANQWVQPKRVSEALQGARRHYRQLGDAGWLAACHWLQHDLVWTKTNFLETARALTEALEILEAQEKTEFVNAGNLSLAYARILLGGKDNYDLARALIDKSETYYGQVFDPVNLARAQVVRASYLRRVAQHSAARHVLNQASTVLMEEGAVIDRAKAQYQLGLNEWFAGDHLTLAIHQIGSAAKVFLEAEMDLWQAACENALGQICVETGDFKDANTWFHEARDKLTKNDIPGLLSDNLNDSARLAGLRGDMATAIDYFEWALRIKRSVASKGGESIVLATAGEMHMQSGNFQSALQHLESALDMLSQVDSPGRKAECMLLLASIWTQLENYSQALDLMDAAMEIARKSGLEGLRRQIELAAADLYLRTDEPAKAIPHLQKVIDFIGESPSNPLKARAGRLLGEALWRMGNQEAGIKQLEETRQDFAIMGMEINEAECRTQLANFYLDLDMQLEAQVNWELSLDQSVQIAPDIAWQCEVGLAKCAEIREEHLAVLAHYRRALERLQDAIFSFWQPKLVDTYKRKSLHWIDSAVHLAQDLGRVEDTLAFIEGAKPTTLIQQISAVFRGLDATQSSDLQGLRDQLLFLQRTIDEKMQKASFLEVGKVLREHEKELRDTVEIYEAAVERHARSGFIKIANPSLRAIPSMNLLRARANTSVDGPWIILNYYVANNTITCLVITRESHTIFQQTITPRLHIAIRQAMNPSHADKADLELLGDSLLPEVLIEQLPMNSKLIIVPHRELSLLPWPALFMPNSNKQLIDQFEPSVIPSIRSLEWLWERRSRVEAPRQVRGLVTAIADFGGRKRALPFVKKEIAAIAEYFPQRCTYLLDEGATKKQLFGMRQSDSQNLEAGLQTYSFVHIASHIDFDPRSGRLSSLALYDDDILLDEWQRLGRMPEIVIFSACSGARNYQFEGGELYGFPVQSLISGAHQVIGSLVPVVDEEAAALMTQFYKVFNHSPQHPSKALATAQRAQKLVDTASIGWAYFFCFGLPDRIK